MRWARRRAGLAAVICAGLVLALVQWRMAGALEISGYVYDSCGGCFSGETPCKPCTVELRLVKDIDDALRVAGLRGKVPYRVNNLLQEAARLEFAQLLEQQGLDAAPEYPVVVVGGQLLAGQPVLDRELSGLLRQKYYGPLAPLFGEEAAGGVDIQLVRDGRSRIVYFQTEGCAQCGQTAALLEALQGDHSFAVDAYDLADPQALEIAWAYCQAYGLEPDTLVAPTVLVGDRALSGYAEIEVFLELCLAAGEARDTPAPAGE